MAMSVAHLGSIVLVCCGVFLPTSFQSEFRPIRIVPFFYELDSVLDSRGQQRLQTVTREAVAQVRNTLSVVPVEGSLILTRNVNEACSTLIAQGPNKLKCSQVNGAYLNDGEKCNNEFKIPAEHLDGLSVWNATWEQPVKVIYQPGVGVKNADFILYIRANPAANCVMANALAYTKSCSRAESGRPLAAFINFCPKLVMEDYHEQRAQQIVLHELLHALGMSKDLFNTFTECHPSGCSVRNVVVEDIDGLPAIVTPEVVKRARRHFACSTDEKRYLGVPLHIENGRYTSHWDERFMQSSIMVPALGLSHQTVMDEITLALFADTGWYHVNYSQAQPFFWGKGAGCKFFQKTFCETDQKYFCQSNVSVCHSGLLDKALCTAVDDCFIPKSKTNDECFLPMNSDYGSVDELYSARSRCFISTLSTNSSVQMSGRCYEHRCNQTGLLEIRIRDSAWTVCPPGASVNISDYFGSVQCPPDGVLCLTADPPPTTLPPPTTTLDPDRTTVVPYNMTEDAAIVIKLEFTDLPYHVISRPSDKYIFTRSVMATIVRHTGVEESRMTGVEVLSGSVLFTFLLNPDTQQRLSTTRVYSRLESAVKGRKFVLEFSGISLQPDVISWQSVQEVNEETRAHVTIAVAVSLTVLVLAALIAATLALWRRHQKDHVQYSITAHSRQRLDTNLTNVPQEIVFHSGGENLSYTTAGRAYS